MLIPVVARSKAWVCGSSRAGISGSNSDAGMDVCLFRALCFDMVVDSETGQTSYRGILPSVVGLCVISKPQQCRCKGPLRPQSHEQKKYLKRTVQTIIILKVSNISSSLKLVH